MRSTHTIFSKIPFERKLREAIAKKNLYIDIYFFWLIFELSQWSNCNRTNVMKTRKCNDILSETMSGTHVWTPPLQLINNTPTASWNLPKTKDSPQKIDEHPTAFATANRQNKARWKWSKFHILSLERQIVWIIPVKRVSETTAMLWS
jgi:hypothetical protein